MNTAPYLSIVVPAYNEVGRIRETLAAMRTYLDGQSYGYEIIVSADGTDGTREAAAEFAGSDERIRVMGSQQRAGKGRGVRNGVLAAHGQIIGFIDADYKTAIDEVEKVLPWFDQGFDVVIGSRALSTSRIEKFQPLYRRVGSKVFNRVLRAAMGLREVRDTQCGFKFMRAAVARDIFSRQAVDGYMFDVEILMLVFQLNYRLKEVGVAWRDDGDTRYDPVTGTLRNARELARIRYGQLRHGIPTPAAERLAVIQTTVAETPAAGASKA